MSGVDEYTMWLERSRTGRNVDQLERSYEALRAQVARLDPETLAVNADLGYRADDPGRIQIPFLHSWFVLHVDTCRLDAQHAETDTLPLKTLVLHHLIAASENQGTAVRVMGEWIDCRSLQDGAVLGAHLAKSTTDNLARFFARSREEKLDRAMSWGGKPLDLGDEGFQFDFFPRLPVALINWKADDEFPAYGKILYDISASNYMPTHGLTALTEYLVHRLAE